MRAEDGQLCRTSDRDQGHDDIGGGHDKVRELLDDEPAPAHARTAQRVHVDQEQRRREHDGRGLRHDGAHQGRHRQAPPERRQPPVAALLDGAEIPQDGQEVEEHALHVPPLGDPDDGLHAQRVDGEK